METKGPPLFDTEEMKISFSGTNMYLNCGKQFEFRYIQGIKIPPKVVMIEGSSHHKAMEMNNKRKMKEGRDMKASRLTEIFMEDFRERIKPQKKTINWEGENENRIFDRARSLHVDYVRSIAPSLRPVAAEEWFNEEVTIDGVTFILNGVIDLKNKTSKGNTEVLDYKVKSKSASKQELQSDHQLSLYSRVAGVKQAGHIVFLKKANPEVGIVRVRRTQQQQEWALKVTASVVKAVKAGVFPMASPSSWICSQRFCGYWNRCAGNWQ